MAMLNPFHEQVFTRKPSNWSDEHIPAVTLPDVLTALRGLTVYPATGSPNETLAPWVVGRYFIMELPNGDRFLINTEGYNYCRYVARIPIKEPLTGADLVESCVGEQVGYLIDIVREVATNGVSAGLRTRAKALIEDIERMHHGAERETRRITW